MSYVIPKSQLQRCFQQWQQYWTLCKTSERDYFEGNRMKNKKKIVYSLAIDGLRKLLDKLLYI